MSSPRGIRALAAAAATAAATALGGCGGSTTHTVTSTKTVTTTTTAPSPAPSSSASGTIETLPLLGSLSYTCRGARPSEVTFDGAAATATESVTVEGDGGRHLRAATLNPGMTERLTIAVGANRTLIWRVIQSTEPDTRVATVRVTFNPQNGFACALGGFATEVGLISHAGAWTPPKAWP